MKRFFIGLSLVFLIVWAAGCNKDDSEVDKLEQDVMMAEKGDTTADSAALAADTETMAMQQEQKSQKPIETAVGYEATEFGGFTVQVAAGIDAEKARYTAEIFAGRGYEPFIVKADVGGITFYRVRIGNFDTVEEARILATELQDRYSLKPWIDHN